MMQRSSQQMGRAAARQQPGGARHPAPQRTRRVRVAAAAAQDNPARGALEAFYYGKAFAAVLNRRLGEAAAALLSGATRAAADAPLQLQQMQDEVQAMVLEELGAEGMPSIAGGSSSASSTPGGGGGGGGLPTGGAGDGIKGYNTAPTDLQAIVDELRADIAASRAVLQQLKAQP
ncbi:MAG: hypothetical protein J3K34DRAFT_280359 [Monoraphidium minutum]|nr:MAG: hypothetical protein J3K34DRAFT_280359 [Monoraphidium minutum]